VGEKFWGLGEKSGIDIKNGGLFFFGEAGGFSQEKSAGDIFPFWVGVGKVGSDITCAEGTEDGIGQSVEKDICVGVTFEPTFVGNGDGTEDEGTPRDQRMNIITKANAQHGERMSRELAHANGFRKSSSHEGPSTSGKKGIRYVYEYPYYASASSLDGWDRHVRAQ
jgi:hypothetical protein